MSCEVRRNRLRAACPVIAPSMLKCDFSNLQREVAQLDAAGAAVYHWDVMDGHFVPNLSYGAMVIERVRPLTNAFFDAHLMISNPEQYLDSYLKAGCDLLTVHIEAAPNPVPLFDRIHNAGRLAGLALNPQTPIERITPYLDKCDLVLVMSVEPGFGGQRFIPGSLARLTAIRAELPTHIVLAVDGGIDPETIAPAAQAGASFFVVGSAIFEEPDYSTAMANLRQRAGATTEPS